MDWGMIAGVYAVMAFYRPWFLWPLAGLVIGARLHALAILGHDATHRLGLKHRKWNDAVAEFFIACPLFVVLDEGYRTEHFGHHKLLGTEVDPELKFKGLSPYIERVTWGRIARIFSLDLLGLGVVGLARFMTSIFPRRQPWRMLFPVLWWAAVTGFAHATHSLWIVGLWIYPMVTGFWAIFRVRVWTEHVGVPYHGKESSHRFTVGPLGPFFFFPHHTYCHYEHHKWPQIPYYSLPAVRSADDSRPILPLKDLFPTR